MFSAGTWLRTHQSSHKKFLLLEQCRDKMATAQEGSFSPEFLQKMWRPASERASLEALWLVLPCSSQHFASSAPLARQVLCIFIHNRELWLPHDKNKMFSHTPALGRCWIRDPGSCTCPQPQWIAQCPVLLSVKGKPVSCSPVSLQRQWQPTSPLVRLLCWSPSSISSCNVLFPC